MLLNEEPKDISFINTMLPKCLPEWSSCTTRKPAICTVCNVILSEHLIFLANCYNTEQKIKDCCEIRGTNNRNPSLLRSITENISAYRTSSGATDSTAKYENEEIKEPEFNKHFVEVKTQKIDVKCEDADINTSESGVTNLNIMKELMGTHMLDNKYDYPDMIIDKKIHNIEEGGGDDLKHMNFMKTETQELHIKHENVEIKTEETDFARCYDDMQDISLQNKITQNNLLIKRINVEKDIRKGRVYECVDCEYKTKLKSSLNVHMIRHKDISEVTIYQCEVCEYKTKYKFHLNQHLIRHKDISQVTMFDCEVCEYKTKYKFHLKQHMVVHKDTYQLTMYQCNLCEYRTANKSGLRKHMNVHKNASEITWYDCEICGSKFKHKRSLKQHMKVHENTLEETWYSCDICLSKLRTRYSFQLHMLLHKDASEVNMYCCDICDYKTKIKWGLKKHKLVHKDVSEIVFHECKICGSKLKSKNNLTKHMKIHKDASELIVSSTL